VAFSAENYRQQLLSLLPRGRAWTRDTSSIWYQLFHALGAELSRVDGRSGDLIEEADTTITSELLAEWEDEFSLPDPCVENQPTTTDDRRAIVVLHQRLVNGRQDKPYFIGLADAVDATITITEFTPFWSGVGVSGDECGDQPNLFYWMVTFIDAGGISDSVREQIECTFGRYKPAHTIILWDEGVAFNWAFSRAFDAPITSGDRYLTGAFHNAFSHAFDVRWGGAFSRETSFAFDRTS